MKRWLPQKLLPVSLCWCRQTRKRLAAAHERSTWWIFISAWNKHIDQWLRDFRTEHHCFSPLMEYRFSDGMIQVWSYLDRLMMHLILKIIRPTFKHIISGDCYHLSGPSAIKGITRQLQTALKTNRFHYVLRVDIRSYYASIDHRILVKQMFEQFDDPVIRHYLEAIITIGIDRGGEVFLPTKGIPRNSSLSPFFGALYLSPLDRAFEKRKNCFYCRYSDDIILLVETKRQYQKARKHLFKLLRELRLTISPKKTRMGRLIRGFHYLGVKFEASRNPQKQTQMTSGLHQRTYCRALDKVKALREDAVHPAKIQRYLIRWAIWWRQVIGGGSFELIENWITYTKDRSATDVWVGRGLRLGSPCHHKTISQSPLQSSRVIA